MKQFLTLAELSRETGVPASRIQAAVEGGLIHPAGRAGSHTNSPIIFDVGQLEEIKAYLAAGFRPQACATETPKPHTCRNAAEVRAKAEALARARQEDAK